MRWEERSRSHVNRPENLFIHVKQAVVPFIIGVLGAVPLQLPKSLTEWKIKERIKTIQMIASFILIRIVRRVLKYWENLLSFNLYGFITDCCIGSKIQRISQLLKQSSSLSRSSLLNLFFLFLGYCSELEDILIYSTKYNKIMSWMMEQKIFCEEIYDETKSLKIVQNRYRGKFNFNSFPNKSQIFKLIKNFEADGTCEIVDQWISHHFGLR